MGSFGVDGRLLYLVMAIAIAYLHPSDLVILSEFPFEKSALNCILSLLFLFNHLEPAGKMSALL
jgi:hypothetical protein